MSAAPTGTTARSPAADETTRRLALAGVVGPVVWWFLVVVNAAATPGYSHVGDFISTLGSVGAPYAVVQQVNFLVLGGAIAALALGVHRHFGDGRRPRVGTLLLVVMALGIALSGPFQSDPAAPASTTNVLHDLVGGVAFLAGIAAIALLTRRFSAADGWPTRRYETAATVAVVVATFALFMATIDGPLLGLTQRLFVGAFTAWVAGQSLRLYRLSGG